MRIPDQPSAVINTDHSVGAGHEERAEEAQGKAASERLFAMRADMLCPKKTRGGIFAEPVVVCGRNKNEPKPPIVNVYVRQD